MSKKNIFNHGGNITQYGHESGIIDFSSNINPLGLSKKSLKIFKNIKQVKFFIENYPEVYPYSFTESLSNYHGIEKKYIYPGAGASDIIFNIAKILNPDKIIIVEPSFFEYERAAILQVGKSNIIHVNTYFSENFELKSKSLLKLLEYIKRLNKNDIIFLASPSNPAGTITPIQTIVEILGQLKAKNAFLVLDESFMDFCENFSSKSLVKNFNNLIIIRSMTKFFAMPGQRIGYCFANPKIITKLAETSIPWKITSLASKIASISLNDKNYILKSLEHLKKLKQDFYRKLNKINSFQIVQGSMANFFLIKIKNDGLNAKDLKENLLKSAGILIRYCGDYHGLNNKYFRIAIRKRIENNYLIEKLTDLTS